ncbi:hypothetical protein BDA96_03G447900 [Sorghum bicolor]|jgi:hypothetical protein|uniref:Rapid alkalinization factor 1 n=1 Tax=Sorghum bicolor TaxID=4558 RepID=A0A921UQN5_SORBI|nr:hypothetical protein BDA96_03G447900 [Sorghum bicolor]
MAHVDRPPSRAVLAVAVAAAALLLVVAAGAPRAAGQTTTTTTVVDPDSWADRGAACTGTGTVEECGMARRELGYGGYISYDAMSRGRVPCSYRGASYYNCRPGAPANPYSRGCSAITRCRG